MKAITTFLAACALGGLCAAPCLSQDEPMPVTPEEGVPEVDQDEDGVQAPEIEMPTSTLQQPAILKGSDVLGAQVYDPDGQRVGRVHDLVLDKQGRVVAAQLDVNLGDADGDKEGYLAVPPASLAPRYAAKNDETGTIECEGLTIDKPMAALGEAPRHDAVSPLDDAGLKAAYEFFGESPISSSHGRSSGTDGAATGGEYGMDDGDHPGGNPLIAKSADGWCSGSELVDKPVMGTDGEKVGSVDDLALSASNDGIDQEVKYVVVASGGFMGINDEQHAVPFDALKRGPEGKLSVGTTAAELEQAEGFNGKWPETANRQVFARSSGGDAPSPSGI